MTHNYRLLLALLMAYVRVSTALVGLRLSEQQVVDATSQHCLACFKRPDVLDFL